MNANKPKQWGPTTLGHLANAERFEFIGLESDGMFWAVETSKVLIRSRDSLCSDGSYYIDDAFALHEAESDTLVMSYGDGRIL